jgi:cell division protein FtsX
MSVRVWRNILFPFLVHAALNSIFCAVVPAMLSAVILHFFFSTMPERLCCEFSVVFKWFDI